MINDMFEEPRLVAHGVGVVPKRALVGLDRVLAGLMESCRRRFVEHLDVEELSAAVSCGRKLLALGEVRFALSFQLGFSSRMPKPEYGEKRYPIFKMEERPLKDSFIPRPELKNLIVSKDQDLSGNAPVKNLRETLLRDVEWWGAMRHLRVAEGARAVARLAGNQLLDALDSDRLGLAETKLNALAQASKIHSEALGRVSKELLDNTLTLKSLLECACDLPRNVLKKFRTSNSLQEI